MQSPSQSTTNCPSGHKLIFTDKPMSMGTTETFYCNTCNAMAYVVQGRWVCNACNYSICTNCKKPPYKSAVCPSNHPLQWNTTEIYSTLPGLPTGYFMCRNCLGSYYGSSGRWNCPYCSFDICPNCKKPPYTSTTCPSGHALAWSAMSNYAGGLYCCNQCGSNQPTANGRWWCQECQFDICPNCKSGGSAPPPMPPMAPSQPLMGMSYPQPQPVMSVPYQQPMYMPQPSYPQPSYVPMSYPQPAYSPVTVQVSSYPGYPTGTAQVNPTPGPLTCPSGHALLLSKTSVGYYNATFKCNVCLNQYSCLVQRWNCSKCKYDVCKHCRPF